MASGFDLSPVIQLLNVLSPADRASAPQTALQKFPHYKNPPRLGDFTTLWNFLGREPLTRPTTPASEQVPTRPISTPESLETSDRSDTENSNSSVGSLPAMTPAPMKATFNRLLVRKDKDNPPVGSPRTTTTTPVKPVIFKQNPPPVSSPLKSRTVEVKFTSKETSTFERRSEITSDIPLALRRVTLVSKLLHEFPEDAATLNPWNILGPLPARPGIHVFIDNSNIVIGFQELVKTKNGYHKRDRIKPTSFSFHNLSLILERGRPAARRILVGSTPETQVVREAAALSYECNLLAKVEKESPSTPKGKGGNSSSSSGSESTSKKKIRSQIKEQAVDEVLNMKILESLLDYPQPSTLVLASGDGAVGEYSEGFFRVVERALNRGWLIELATFSSAMSKSYADKSFRARWKRQFRVLLLDQFVDELLG